MASGRSDAFESVRPVLEDLGQRVLHVGENVEGHLLKLAVTMVIGALEEESFNKRVRDPPGGVK